MPRKAMRSYVQRRDPRTAEIYYEHRAVATRKFGRELSPDQVVHHANGDRRENHPSNLWVFSSQCVHMLWHHYRWREAAGVTHLFSPRSCSSFTENGSDGGERISSSTAPLDV